MGTTETVTDSTKTQHVKAPISPEYRSFRQKLVNDVFRTKTPFEVSLQQLKRFDDFLNASGIEIPDNRPDESGPSTAPSPSNGNAEQGQPAKRASKRGAGRPVKAAKVASTGAVPLTMKAAMCQVIGKGAMRSDQVLEGLKAIGVTTSSQDPKAHIANLLSASPLIFPRVQGERGLYRADPSQLPKGRGRQPGTPNKKKASGEEKEGHPAEAKSDLGTDLIRQFGYDPNTDPIFSKATAGNA